jgi:hypothetical protein
VFRGLHIRAIRVIRGFPKIFENFDLQIPEKDGEELRLRGLTDRTGNEDPNRGLKACLLIAYIR